MKSLKIILATIFVLIVGYFWFGTGHKRLCQVNCANSLIVGIAAGYAPFVSIDHNGKYEGFDIDVAQALAQEMGKTLILQDLGSMSSLFTALDQGKIDAIMWGISITPDRLKKVAMVHYAGETVNSYPLLFWENIPTGINSLHDLPEKTVCVESNSAQQALLDQFTQIHQLPVEKIDDALLNIQYGKALAALVEPAIAKKFQVKYPQIKSLDVLLNATNQEQGIGIVIKPANKLLIRQVQDAVQLLKTSGLMSNFAEKWGIAK